MAISLDLRSWCATAVCIVVCLSVRSADAKQGAADLRAEYERLSTAYAATVPGWRPERSSSGSLLFVAPDVYSGVEPKSERYHAERNGYADKLFELAKRAADSGQLSLAFEWATEAVRENTDHAAARRALGYEQYEGQWLTPYAKRMVVAGKHWDLAAGWVSDGDVDKARKPGRDGWQVRTDNFLVISNDSQAAAADLAAKLERLYQVWRQLFAGFSYSEREVQQLFAGEREPRERHKPFRVFYHRDKQDYVLKLQRRQPRIAETLGIYFDGEREAHFFAGDGQSR